MPPRHSRQFQQERRVLTPPRVEAVGGLSPKETNKLPPYLHYTLRLRGGRLSDDEDDDEFFDSDWSDDEDTPPRSPSPIPVPVQRIPPPPPPRLVPPPPPDLPVALSDENDADSVLSGGPPLPQHSQQLLNFPWEEYLQNLPPSPALKSLSQKYHPPATFDLPSPSPPKHLPNMQHLWMTEGLKNKFISPPKPRILRETHFREGDPLYAATKATIQLHISHGLFVEYEDPSIVMPWFGVTKPNHEVRPIIDCRYVNQFQNPPKFSLPPVNKLFQNLPRSYKHALHYDIKNGFYHIPRHPDSYKYFCIQVDGKYYASTRIMMGETCAPWAFQIWLNAMFKSFLQEMQFTFTPVKKQHIDDLLFIFKSTAQARLFHQKWSDWCAAHGLMLNLPKSTISPVSIIKHIGFELDFRKQVFRLTPTRQKQSLRLLWHLKHYKGTLTQLDCQKIVGFLGWARGGSPLIHGLLDNLITAAGSANSVTFARNSIPFDEVISYFAENTEHHFNNRHMPVTLMITDATTERGGILHEKGAASVIIPSYYRDHIFASELWTAASALLTHTPRNTHIQLLVDNTAVMYALRKGRSTSKKATDLLIKVHRHLHQLGSWLTVTYIKSASNPADCLSRLPARFGRRLLRFPAHVIGTADFAKSRQVKKVVTNLLEHSVLRRLLI